MMASRADDGLSRGLVKKLNSLNGAASFLRHFSSQCCVDLLDDLKHLLDSQFRLLVPCDPWLLLDGMAAARSVDVRCSLQSRSVCDSVGPLACAGDGPSILQGRLEHSSMCEFKVECTKGIIQSSGNSMHIDSMMQCAKAQLDSLRSTPTISSPPSSPSVPPPRAQAVGQDEVQALQGAVWIGCGFCQFFLPLAVYTLPFGAM